MVEIAKALSIDARILIMDEPTSSLTAKEIDDLFRIIRKLRDEGRGIVYISHRLEELSHICLLYTSKQSEQMEVSQFFVETLLRKVP